jgi:quercetin dioxygenase-like cupin family protein
MEIPLAQPGQIVDAWSAWRDAEAKAVILRTAHMEILRLHLNSDVRIPTHEAQGEITILCLQGRVEVAALGERRELNGGQLMYLLVREPFELHAREEASLLITILRQDAEERLIGDDSRVN